MRVSMDANLMAFLDNAFDDLRKSFHAHADEEKGRFHLLGFQNIQNPGRPFGIRTVIKADGHLVLVTGPWRQRVK